MEVGWRLGTGQIKHSPFHNRKDPTAQRKSFLSLEFRFAPFGAEPTGQSSDASSLPSSGLGRKIQFGA